MTPRPTLRSWEEEEVGVSSCCGKRSACLTSRVQLGRLCAVRTKKKRGCRGLAFEGPLFFWFFPPARSRDTQLPFRFGSMAHRGRGLVLGPANAVIRTKKRSLACR